MVHLSMLSKLNFYTLLNSGYNITASREDDVEMEDEELDKDEEENENNKDNQRDVHEGGERMPDIEDIFKRDEGFSFAEVF